MAKQDLIRKKVEETMASLERLERLEAGPDFFPRLKARLDARGPAPASWLRLPKSFVLILRPALLALLVLVNILTVVFVAKAGASRKEVERASVMTMAAEYSLNQNLDELDFTGEDAVK